MTSFTLHGISVSRGIAIGRAHLVAPAALDVKHYLIPDDQVEAEVQRLQSAIATVHKELQTIWNELPKDSPAELGAFIDVHALILSDPMISDVPLDIIRTRYYNAEWALVTQIDELSAQFDEVEDAYLRERKADIQQVGERVLKILTGSATTLPARDGGESSVHMIVVAHDISPADMLQFRDRAFSGFVTDLGGQNSHRQTEEDAGRHARRYQHHAAGQYRISRRLRGRAGSRRQWRRPVPLRIPVHGAHRLCPQITVRG
jgi:phosphotransferase system enzyme I (PtsI)